MPNGKDSNIYKPKSAPIVFAALLMIVLVALIIIVTLMLAKGGSEPIGTTAAITTTVKKAVTTRTPISPSTSTDVPTTTVIPSTTTAEQSKSPITTLAPDTDGEVTTTARHYSKVEPTAGEVKMSSNAIGQGSLILINSTNKYKSDNQLIDRTQMSELSAQKLADTYGFVKVPKCNAYLLKNNKLFLNSDAAVEFINMMCAFAVESGNTDVQLRNAYYYDASEDVCVNCTGYYVDLEINKDQKLYPLNYVKYKSDYYDWFISNSYRFGFIHIGEAKSVSGEDRYSTFRFVGIPHATYMHDNDIEFEDYLKMLKSHTIENLITFTDHDGVAWMIYYVPASGDETTIPVTGTAECYRISGNNTDGFIVTINTAYFS